MALFGSGRDASFVRGINRELINRLIDNEVEIYKLVRDESSHNIYDEASRKSYYQPMRFRSLIERDQKTVDDEDTGITVNRTTSFGFVKQDLKDIPIVIEIGDIIRWDGDYYEVDNVRGSQYWGLRNPSKLIGHVEKEISEFGYGVSVIAECHLTGQTRLQLQDVRVGGKTGIDQTQRNRSIYD
jgi:hypothetical protein